MGHTGDCRGGGMVDAVDVDDDLHKNLLAQIVARMTLNICLCSQESMLLNRVSRNEKMLDLGQTAGTVGKVSRQNRTQKSLTCNSV